MLGDLSQAKLQEGDQTGAAHRIAGPQRPLPELLQMGLEAGQRMVRTSAFFVRIVPYASIRQFAVDGEHHRIEIESERGASLGQSVQFGPQLVVQGHQLADRLGTKALEKTA
jgi:hypothetical protein